MMELPQEDPLSEARGMVKQERKLASDNPHHLVSYNTKSSLAELYKKLGCNRDTHGDKEQFDKCLSAKLYIESLNSI